MAKKEETVHGWTVERFNKAGELEVRFSKPNPDNPNRPYVCRAFVPESSGEDGESQAYDTGLRDALQSELGFPAQGDKPAVPGFVSDDDRPAVEAALAEAQKTLVRNRVTRTIRDGRVNVNQADGLAAVVTRLKNAGYEMMEAFEVVQAALKQKEA